MKARSRFSCSVDAPIDPMRCSSSVPSRPLVRKPRPRDDQRGSEVFAEPVLVPRKTEESTNDDHVAAPRSREPDRRAPRGKRSRPSRSS